ncbi:hypothetical protein E2C01_040899 [Portunus trituberculatus]|uniref:Uncharacterized protein n=1 Tax=Portunus trituberculatus TaxID=210409 RepID=A0A5B7FQ05_PORTR|nr:hypothetical protein [Portunus trituberculatus]
MSTPDGDSLAYPVIPDQINYAKITAKIVELSRFDIPQFNSDIDTTVMQMTDILYDCVIASMSAPVSQTPDNTVSMWEKLLSVTDDRRMRQTIN